MRSSRRILPITVILLAALAAVTEALADENTWTSHGPTGVGSVYNLAVGDGVAYAATPNGVFRSRDGGASWAQAGFAGQSVFSVLTLPGAPVVLALQGSPYAPGLGLYESTDQGETWIRAPGLPAVTLAAMDPQHPSSLYAVQADGAIWMSADAGANWHRLSATPTGTAASSLDFAANAIYLLSFDNTEQQYKFFRSTDEGASWTAYVTPSHEVFTFGGSASPNVVYAGGSKVFCRSADAAATWSCASAPPLLSSFLELPGSAPGEAPSLLGVFGGTVYRSRDGGGTWEPAGALGSDALVGAMASDASGALVLAAASPGIQRSLDRGDSWMPASTGLSASNISALALDPNDSSTVWAGGTGLSEAALFRSPDAGASWSLAGGPGGPVFAGFVAIDPGVSSTVYAADSNVYRSDDSGAHWTASTPPTGVHALAVDPVSPNRVWVAGPSGLFRSDDGARTWGSTSISQEVYSLLFDAGRPGTAYAGSYYDIEPGFYAYPEGGSLFVSYDGGATFTKNNQNFSSGVTAIATDPIQDGVLFVGTQYTGVFHSADKSVTWQTGTRPAGFEGVTSLVADPVRPGRLYATTEQGVFRTVDAAQTWHPFSSGLGDLNGNLLIVSPDGKWLHVGTNGGGVADLDLETHPCSPTPTRLCLVGDRFAVELYARRGSDPDSYRLATASALGGRAGYFAFPFATGNAALPEVVVKMFPNGQSGAAGLSIDYASLTTLPFVFTVTDTVTGDVTNYFSDSSAPLCGGTAVPFAAAESSNSERAATAAGSDEALALLGSRFSVTLAATNPHTGEPLTATAVPQTDQFGYFSFPELTGSPEFPEVVVKMIDGRGVSGNFWFFSTGLTHVAYTLTVTDSVTGAKRTYASATPFCGAADTSAFAD